METSTVVESISRNIHKHLLKETFSEYLSYVVGVVVVTLKKQELMSHSFTLPVKAKGLLVFVTACCG